MIRPEPPAPTRVHAMMRPMEGKGIALLAVLVLASAAGAQGPVPAEDSPAGAGVEWNARNAEHLLNRAGFGARPAEIAYALRIGQAAMVEELLAGSPGGEDPFFLDLAHRPTRAEKAGMTGDERRVLKDEIRRHDREQLSRFAAWWIDQMIDGPYPLRERMVLFWHGHFASAYRDVKDGTAMIWQNETFREHALGNFGELTRAIVRDPAMIRYLDNDSNSKGNPNENLARELMELFTLGEGNYDEEDVKEAARALTGWKLRYPDGAYLAQSRHDRGKKTVLGRTDKFGADGLVDLLLEQPACSRWIAGKLLAYFEGRAPSEQRLERYAALLAGEDYELEPFLRALFLDPEFYSDEVVANRIASPVEYLVGVSRRVGLHPPSRLLWLAGGQLGQRLFDPPSVKGWEGGRAWVTTSTFLQRGNFAGMLLGVVQLDDVLAPEPPELEDDPEMMGAAGDDEMMAGMSGDDEMDDSFTLNRKVQKSDLSGFKRMLGNTYWPRINLTERCRRLGAETDAEIVDLLSDELLAVEVSPAGRAALLDFLFGERERLGARDGELLDAGSDAEHVLRRMAHLILSLPEAQLT